MNFVYTLCVVIICIIDRIYADDCVVQVEQGWLSGQMLQSVINKTASYCSFKGIPYAKPPVGSLRFKDPQSPEAWEGVRNATEHGSVCPQVDMLTNFYVPGSEDCLFLNVYTPKLSNDYLLPVLVFIHGGVYKFGSGNVDLYGPDILMNNEGIVVVTINYRLDALGFMSLGTEEVPGNAGLKDQVFALRWVQANIKNFGGDPDAVTIQGESAGAGSVSLHVLSPMSKGLFKRAVMQSGVAFCDWSNAYYPERRAFALAQDLGFKTKNTNELLEFLQNTTYDKLINTTTAVMTSESQTGYFVRFVPFAPVEEKDFGQERFLPEPPLEMLNAGNVNGEAVVIGYNDRETITMKFYTDVYLETFSRYPEMFVPRKIMEVANATTILALAEEIRDHYFGDKDVSYENMEEFINYSSNSSFVYDIHRYMRKLPSSVSVYFYKFAFSTSWNYFSDFGKEYNISGAAHMDDLLYTWYPYMLNRTLEENSTAYELVSVNAELLANFVKYGNPTPDTSLLGFTWPTFDTETRSFLNATNTPSVGSGADEDEVQFWKGILEKAGMEF